tara:strand:+ start:407 stop:733 length:327 start_codon:yes stop_codon:yes gene_type:complete
MNEEKYNPQTHCCRYWYKDFCECVKDSMKAAKIKSRDRGVNSVLNFLKKNNIDFIESKVLNIVIINPKTDNVFLSLKKENNLFKCRFNGDKKWYAFSRQKFIDKFSKH